LGHPSKFQRVSRLAFVTAATSLTGGQPNFARCLAVSWAATLCIHFRGLLLLTEFCPVQNSLYVQVLCSPILAALLHGTRAVGISGTAAFSRGRHLYSAGRPSRWASAHILVLRGLQKTATLCYIGFWIRPRKGRSPRNESLRVGLRPQN